MTVAVPELMVLDGALTVAPVGVGSLQAIESPLKAPRLDEDTADPPESVRKPAVMVEVALGPVRVDGLALAVSFSRGVVVMEALLTPSQPVLPGPALQPHQLSVASITGLRRRRR